MIANYHTHTWRCHHAHGTEREYVERAIAGGFHTLGFADHTPYPFDNGHVSNFRMLPEQLEDYVSTVLDLRREYAGQIDIRLGLETEYYPRLFPKLLELIAPYPIEYMLLAQHYTGNETDGVYAGWSTQREKDLGDYVSQVREGLSTGRFLYVAHPDLIHYDGPQDVYERWMRRLCEGAKAENVPLEINLLGLTGGRHYPAERFWRLAGEVGNEAVIGCDAHRPENVVLPEGERQARALAERCGVRVVEVRLP